MDFVEKFYFRIVLNIVAPNYIWFSKNPATGSPENP